MLRVSGDVFEIATAMRTVSPVIVGHGCNRKGLMGAGIAKTVRDRFPTAYEHYKQECAADRFELGTAQLVRVSEPTESLKSLQIANMSTQDLPGPDARLWAIERAVVNVLAYVPNTPLLIPEVGCGIGGLDRDTVLDVLSMFDDRLIVVTFK